MGAQERPSWLPAGSAVPAAVAPAPAATVAAADGPTRTYAEWFAWARRNTAEAGRCHAAAAAATAALSSGQDHATAARAAQAAALAPDAPSRPVTADPQTQAYAAWYTYASVDHGMDGARSHAYAQAASLAQARGVNVTAAAAEGARAAGLGGPAPVYAAASPGLATRVGTVGLGFSLGGFFSDPAGRACIYGVVCLVAPFVIHIYFPIMPILGLLYGLRGMGRSNPVLGLAALVINGLALLLTASIFFGIV